MIRAGFVLAGLLLPDPALAQRYRLPLGGDGHDCGGGNCVLTAYKDHGGRDWNCGDRRYFGHGGTDIAPTWAFGDCTQTFPVVAAAGGFVVARHDGEEDHCGCRAVGCASGYGNHVILQHDDGRFTMYGHMARGSVAVENGQWVACGTVLGRVGMTGNTTGPHLHFEVREGGAYGRAVDPYDGPCSGPPTFWSDQGPYGGMPGTACEGAVDPPPGPACGDGKCDAGEDCGSCVADCGDCGPVCGDGWCEFAEGCDACAADCGACEGPICGDRACDWGEGCDDCPDDCGACGPLCGDGACDGGEDCASCAGDCGACAADLFCGDWACSGGEDCGSCPGDCGACRPVCGDGWCEAGEGCGSCPGDCGACGCGVGGHEGNGRDGDACLEVAETWRCVWETGWGTWASQVCRAGAWSTYHLDPIDCAGCCGGYSGACE